ncbi:MAG TPA: YciI family protein [Urbifossiella sp.]|jgi:hypothetical protein|nr:YciI family protein [Urbifossiella sp.]
MKYMLLMYGAEGNYTDAERRACMIESLSICDQLAAQGKFLAASPLEPVSTAATIRVRDGRALVTDGPFAETTEQLGGYFLLDLADLDEAIAVAGRLPPTRKGTAEIRPVFALDGLPPSRPLPAGPGDQPYMLLCYDDEAALRAAGPDARRAGMAEATDLARELSAAGRYIAAAPLHPSATATSVRVRDGKRAVTDGPFAETTEVLGGYYVILAGSREEALRVAARHPGVRHGAVEVRPLFDLSAVRDSLPVSEFTVDSRAAHPTTV